MKKGWIYIHTNTITGKQYVGQTITNLKNRWSNGNGYKPVKNSRRNYLWNAIQQDGWENFEHLAVQVPECFLDFLETSLIRSLNTLAPNGYNLDSGGKKNKRMSSETKARMSETRKGSGNGMYGKHHSDETKKLIGQSELGNSYRKGKPCSEETKQLLREKCSGWHQPKDKIPLMIHRGEDNGMYGKTHNEETRNLISKKVKESLKASGFTHKGSIWITNGEKNKRIHEGDLIPDGWSLGMTSKNK